MIQLTSINSPEMWKDFGIVMVVTNNTSDWAEITSACFIFKPTKIGWIADSLAGRKRAIGSTFSCLPKVMVIIDGDDVNLKVCPADLHRLSVAADALVFGKATDFAGVLLGSEITRKYTARLELRKNPPTKIPPMTSIEREKERTRSVPFRMASPQPTQKA
jgi:hypothetical protein